MSALHPLQPIALDREGMAGKDIGPVGELRWIPLAELFIDQRYQRPVARKGVRNIKSVAANFRWSLFSPLVVAHRGPGQWAIIDGQHRATAAASRGDIKSVPCLVIRGGFETEARAFSTINGFVTKMSSLSLFRADVAAADADAVRLVDVCSRAGATILGYPKANCPAGETMAVGTLQQCLKRFGEEVLELALRMVTKTGDGNAGLLREGIIAGGCDVLFEHPKWRGSAVIDAVDAAGVGKLHRLALKRKGDAATATGSVRLYYGKVLTEALQNALGDGGTRPQTIRTGTRDTSGRRFTGKPKKDPAGLNHLAADHPAILENRTLFPSTVVDPDASQRLLVSGANSVKLGAKVLKGEWSGFPIYQLSLEERASCPPTCNNRLTCYGNAMPFARRHRHGPALVARLETELAALQASSPDGFVVRLHVLGDFYSAEYVGAWSDFLHRFPALHVFGYTAWDRKSEIGDALLRMTRAQWSRFAIRFSAERSAPQGATTIWRKPEGAVVAEGVVCPAQSDATACCATCGLCWSASARDKTIVFIGHGGVGNGGRKPAEALPQPAKAVRAPLPRVVQRDVIEATGPAKEIVAYLRRAGVDVEALPENRFRYYGSKISFDELVARANRQRLVDGLEKFKVSA